MKLKSALVYAAALIMKPFPRNKHLWLTGKVTSWEYKNSPPAFFDNSKYFYLYLIHKTNEKVYWISSSKKEIALLKSMKLPVVKFPSVRGIWLTLRAKFFFHHYGIDQIDSRLQAGSIQINFWHAMPFKKMRYSVVVRVEHRVPFLGQAIEYALSSSAFLTESVCREMYGLPADRILDFGYPRQDILRYDKNDLKIFCSKYSRNLHEYIDIAEKHENVFLYMPTWRDDDPDYFAKLDIDYPRLNHQLSQMNGIMFLKLHPLTKNVSVEGFERIINIKNSIDIYPFLPFVNYLITDYSSICYDYLLLDKEIIFIPYDIEKYRSMRGLYFDYDTVTPGKKYDTFNDFIDHIQDVPMFDYREERKALKEKFFDDYKHDACKRTYEFFSENRNEMGL